MKRIISVISVLLLVLSGCGSSYSAEDFNPDEVIKSAEITSNEEILGSSVEMIGAVASDPEADDDGTYYTIMTSVDGDPINDKYISSEVLITDPNGKIDATYGDYLDVTGVVTAVELEDSYLPSTPVVEVVEAKPMTQTEALSPALKTVDVNKSQTKSDVTLTLKSIEFSPIETRLNVAVDNQTNYEADLSEYGSKIVVDSKNYEPGSDFWSDEIVDLPSDTLPKSMSEGVIAFPALDYENITDFKFVMSGDLDDDDWTDLDYSIETTIE